MKKSNQSRFRHLQYEALEPREVMAASVTGSLSVTGVLTVMGTEAADQINFRQISNQISIVGVLGKWDAGQVKSIIVELKGGNDYVSFQSALNGGNQAIAEAITIKSGAGNERVRLASGLDINMTGAAHTLDLAADGTAKLDGAAFNLTGTVKTALQNGVLTITGTSYGDDLQLIRLANNFSIKGISGSWAASSVTSIVILLQDGTDSVSLDSLANGGNQALGVEVTVLSGNGSDRVRLAGGKDIYFTGLGNTLNVTAAANTATLNGRVVYSSSQTPPPAPPAPPAPTPPSPGPQTNWFSTNITDAAMRNVGSTLYLDGIIDRSDMIAILRSARDNAAIDATELADLRKIVANTTLFAGLDFVRTLSNYIVNGSVANRNYQGQALGNMIVGSSDAVVDKLINKWFLGLDRPEAAGTYRQIAGTLFVNGAQYSDIHQGAIGDCYFVSALAETALRNQSVITNMFVVNGDGTYTVKFFNYLGQADYVTVDSYLPTNSSGQLIYATRGVVYNGSGNELWVALAEKAYAQLNEFGWSRGGTLDSGKNSYAALEGGYIYAAMNHITGKSTLQFASTSTTAGFQTFVTAWSAGKMVGFASKVTPASGSGIVGSHAYAVVGYNATNQTITLFNPWGTEYGLVTMTWSQIQANFQYFDRTA